MAFELKEGHGTWHKNNKAGNEKRPDYRGELLLNGVVYELAGWIKDGKRGKWMSVAAKPKDAPKVDKPAPKPAQDFEDDIPF